MLLSGATFIIIYFIIDKEVLQKIIGEGKIALGFK
jgi:hypothetical protein